MKRYNECRIFHEGKRAIYCAYDNGSITRTWKVSKKEEKVKTFIAKGKAVTKIDGINIVVKHLMAELFIKGYKKGMSVICQDKNEFNCNIDNLLICTKKQLGKETGHLSNRNYKLIVTDQQGMIKTYFSIRSAAKDMHCSYQTIIDYMNGKVNKSVLTGYKIKRIA